MPLHTSYPQQLFNTEILFNNSNRMIFKYYLAGSWEILTKFCNIFHISLEDTKAKLTFAFVIFYGDIIKLCKFITYFVRLRKQTHEDLLSSQVWNMKENLKDNHTLHAAPARLCVGSCLCNKVKLCYLPQILKWEFY